jgi:hypothetical protein
MQYHSLAQLLVELMQVELPPQWDLERLAKNGQNAVDSDEEESDSKINNADSENTELQAKVKHLNDVFN